MNYSTHWKSQFNTNLVTKSFVFLFIMIIPFNIIHEYGHAIACAYEGFKFIYSVTVFGASLSCFGDLDNVILFRALGGLLAAIVALAPYLILKKNLARYPFIIIVLLSLSIGHGFNAVIETVFYNDYIANGVLSMFSILIVQSFVFILLASHYSKKVLRSEHQIDSQKTIITKNKTRYIEEFVEIANKISNVLNSIQTNNLDTISYRDNKSKSKSKKRRRRNFNNYKKEINDYGFNLDEYKKLAKDWGL